jgi:hypothetical protein
MTKLVIMFIMNFLRVLSRGCFGGIVQLELITLVWKTPDAKFS